MKRILSLVLAAFVLTTATMTSLADDTTTRMQLGVDATHGNHLSGALLTPGEEYRFPVTVSIEGGEQTPLTQEILEDYSFRLTNTGKGSSLETMNLSRVNGAHYIVAKVKAGWPAASTEEEYAMKLVKKSDGKTAAELTVAFETGYATMSDDAIAALGKEDAIVVNNDTPVFTAEQLERIAKLSGYKKVTFENDGWSYTVNITDMKDINMLHNTNAVKEIVSKYEDNNFEFLTFPAGTKFKTAGTVEISAANFVDDFGGKFFVYRYLDGKLTLIESQYDAQEEMLSFNTNTLGRFVITDKAIRDAIVVPVNNGSSSGSNNNSSNGSSTPENPNTGARATSPVAALAALALMAGVVAAAKRK